jgi:hypothetical protein
MGVGISVMVGFLKAGESACALSCIVPCPGLPVTNVKEFKLQKVWISSNRWLMFGKGLFLQKIYQSLNG